MSYSLGAKIRVLRGKLTQDELADKINAAYGTSLNKGMISKWENNLIDPSLEYARILVQFFGVTLDELLGLTEDAQEEPETIAAHHDGEDWSEEEAEQIQKFKDFIKSQRPKE